MGQAVTAVVVAAAVDNHQEIFEARRGVEVQEGFVVDHAEGGDGQRGSGHWGRESGRCRWTRMTRNF